MAVTLNASTITINNSIVQTPGGSAPSYLARAWVNFNGVGTVSIRASGNVASITDNGVGDYTVNMSTGLDDANYALIGTAGAGNANLICVSTNFAYNTASVRIQTLYQNISGYDADRCQVAIFR